uniref:Uncharacterized protein n=1 Tax=Vespula pensylvanica TaxID=30213 RepID=A0A834U8E8_VESPE|nr:hypothetical protein H0235_009365 [Vespula pensylvanica]
MLWLWCRRYSVSLHLAILEKVAFLTRIETGVRRSEWELREGGRGKPELKAIESKAPWKREGVRKFIAEGNRTDKSRSLDNDDDDDDDDDDNDIDIDIDLYRYDTSLKPNSAPPFDHTLLTPNTPHIVFQ